MAMLSNTEPSIVPMLRSHIGHFTFLEHPRIVPPLRFQALDGSTIDLAQFRGKLVVLHFWATWCILCVYELPALDRLAAHRADEPFAVVAISLDREGLQVVRPFLERNRIAHLQAYLDPDGAAASTLPLLDIPSSYLIDQRGEVIGYIAGMTDWDSLEAKRFLDYFVSRVAR